MTVASRILSTMKVHGPDRKGIVAASSELLNRHGCAIVQSEHYTDRECAMFFQRIVFDDERRYSISPKQDTMEHKLRTTAREETMANEFRDLLTQFAVEGEIDWMRKPKRVAIMVSKLDHCLWELLLRHQANELLQCEIPIVLSNHEACRSIVQDTFGIPYAVFPMSPATKAAQEQKEIDLLQQQKIDLIVLARYMQVLSPRFLQAFPTKIINIHHSFLPAFCGGRAYHQAHERGVKLIGATVSIFCLFAYTTVTFHRLCWYRRRVSSLRWTMKKIDRCWVVHTVFALTYHLTLDYLFVCWDCFSYLWYRPTTPRWTWTKVRSWNKMSLPYRTVTVFTTFSVKGVCWNALSWSVPSRPIWTIAWWSITTSASSLATEPIGIEKYMYRPIVEGATVTWIAV